MADRMSDPFEFLTGERARRRRILRDLDAMNRRGLLKLGAGAVGAGLLGRAAGDSPAGAQSTPAASAAALPEFGEVPEALKGSGQVIVAGWGGAMQEAQQQAYYTPFTELCGIEVVIAEQQPDPSKIVAMVQTGNIEYDVMQDSRSSVIRLEQQGEIWEPVNYDLFDTANIDEGRRYTYSIDMLPYAWVIAYRTDAFPEGPRGQADFYDTAAFPGPRSTTAGAAGLSPFLESALLADGVPMAELYPLDIERAFAKLSTIKGDVVKFWDAGSQPAQLLNDNEAVLVHAWNGRIAAIQETGAPAAIQWNEAMQDTDVWAAIKGSPNAENAQKFMAFTTLPVSQARLSMLIPYGFVNNAAAELIPAERLATLSTAPEYADVTFTRDVQWWVDNTQAVQDRWNEWILE
jgi:putative spermidine/putrescine transport system substrate-binding protein